MYAKVYVEITNICNMNCSFCHGHTRPLARMSEGAFAHILGQLEGQTQYIYYHLMGEPLTHPQFPRFLRMAADRGFKSIITTNGTLLKSRGASLLEKGLLHKVNLSIHSFEGKDPKAYEAYLSDVADFAESAAEVGVIVVFRLWNKGCDGGNNDTALSYLRSRLVGDWAENARGIRIRDRMYLEFGERFGWPDKDAPVQGDQVFCYGMKDHFGILCDGTVVPCCLDSDGVISLGNIHREPIADILASPRAEAIVKGFAKRQAAEELCRRCPYAQRFV